MPCRHVYSGYCFRRLGLLPFVMSIVFVMDPSHADDFDSQPDNSARYWIAEWGEKWWEGFHDDIEAWYPGGRSDRFHNKYVEEAMRGMSESAWEDWEISNERYIYHDDWFAVEWFYRAIQPSTGKEQIEATLAFGRVQDGRMIELFEFFDDMVGRYQGIGAMRLFDRAEEEPFPWPPATAISREYRP